MEYSFLHTADPKMKKILEAVDNYASSRATILIQGESGTGKELLARYIHSKGLRASRRFQAINCAAVPEGLLESELFGYEKGAFTGAHQRKIGKFELAHESTFLLDEITEMPALLQAKLLRVIQEGEIERLGSNQTIKVNVRIIATTNRDLKQAVQQGLFREDLFYRLNVIPIEIPPLRNRPKDIELLSQLFLEISCTQNKIVAKSFSEEAKKKLSTWAWPGNVRELQNVIERSTLLSAETVLSADSVMIENYKEQEVHQPEFAAGMKVAEVEKLLILKTLEHTHQNRTHAAHLLGISVRTLRNKINEYNGVITHE